MDGSKISNPHDKESLISASTHIWNHILAFLNSMALKCAIELGIPNAIHKHGMPITITNLANLISIHPSKIPFLHQLMRLLVHSNFFTLEKLNNGDEVYDLTINSQLLLKDHPLNQAPFALLAMDSVATEASQCFGHWFQNKDSCSPFQVLNNKPFYESISCEEKFSEFFNLAMESDTRLISSLLVSSNEFKGLIDGVETLVDVGGGDGTMAKAIVEAYPKVNVMVFDLPHVVGKLQGNGGNLTYVQGDMFVEIPHAQVALLKWVLHNWSDDECIKILKQCKEAIPSKEKGGKLLIIEIVIGIPNGNQYYQSQLLMDMQMMCVFGTKQRTMEQWKYIFTNAGFNDFNILPILGTRSLIEVYPA